MTKKIFFLILLFPLIFACQKNKQSVEDIYREIRKHPQTSNPEDSDKKTIALRKLVALNDSTTCDTLKAIFYEIDTTNGRYWDLQSVVLNVLLDINTEKSYRTFAKILGKTKIPCPMDYQTYFNKIHDNIEKVKYVFPDLAKGLLTQEWINDDLLILLKRGYKEGLLIKDSLKTTEPFLIDFYNQLKVERDSLPGATHWRYYYRTHLAHLLDCLRIFSDSSVNKIYLEVLNDNSSFADYEQGNSGTDYWNESMPKLWILRQALMGLIENDQSVPVQYTDKVMKDPLFRFFVYEDAIGINKQQNLPKKYLTQSNFALSDLIHSMWEIEDGGIPDRISFVGKDKLNNGLWEGTYYFYDVVFMQNEHAAHSLMVSGPQPLEPDSFVYMGALTRLYVEHDPDTTRFKVYMDKIMTQIPSRE